MARKHTSRFQQMKIYFGRNRRGFFNDKGWKLLISVVLITILICSVTGESMFRDHDQTKSGAFALVCASIWIGIFNSIRVICREREILKREHRTGLHMSSYVVARWLFEACLCAAEVVPVTVIVWFVNREHFIEQGIILPPLIELYISFFLITFSADALALVISAVVKDENTAMTVMPFALIIQLIMSGMVFELKGIPEKVSTLTISRWGLNAICTSADVNAMARLSYNKEMEATAVNLLHQWGILLLFAVVYAILTVIALEFVDSY